MAQATNPLEALGCAMNVFQRCDVRPDHTVAVVGVGFLGAVLTSLCARLGARVLALSRRSEPDEAWGGRAAVHRAQRLAEGARFEPAAERIEEVAQVLDAIYGSAGIHAPGEFESKPGQGLRLRSPSRDEPRPAGLAPAPSGPDGGQLELTAAPSSSRREVP